MVKKSRETAWTIPENIKKAYIHAFLKDCRKSAAILLSAALLLTACVHDSRGASPLSPAEALSEGKLQQQAGTGAGSTAFNDAASVKITGYLLGSNLPGFKDVLSELNARLKKDLNVKMNVNYVGWGEVQSKFPLILAAGEDVDWVFTGSWAFYSQLAAKGAFLEITPALLQKYMTRHYALIKDTTAFSESMIKGRSYMVTTSSPDRKVPVFIYREDLRKKYGVEPINRFSDIEPYLQAIKANEPGMIPMNLGSNYDLQQPHTYLLTEQYDLVQDLLTSTAGGSGIVFKPLDTDGRLYYLTSDPIMTEYKKVAVRLKSWYDKGYINRNAFANRIRSKESFVQAKSAIGFGNSIDIQGSMAQAAAQNFEVGLVPIVSGKSGHAIADPYIGNGFALSANSKNVQFTLRAMDLIMEDEEYSNLVYFGIEGKNYTVQDGKIVLLNDEKSGKNNYPPDQAGFWFSNKDHYRPLASWPPSYIDLKERMKTLLAPNVYAAFSPTMDNVKTETDNCNQIITQYLNPIHLGAFDDIDAAFAMLDDKLKAANIEKVMAEMSIQTREFLEEHR